MTKSNLEEILKKKNGKWGYLHVSDDPESNGIYDISTYFSIFSMNL